MYYSETIEKNTKYRADYLDGINDFLSDEKAKAEEERKAFITPEKYAENPEYYRAKFVETLGFPLTKKREMPTAEKTFVAKDGNVNIYRMQFTFFGKLKTYGLYFEQTENAKNAPFIFGFHGGAGTPELVSSIHGNSGNYNHLVRRITDRGANVFAPQFLLWSVDTYGNEYNRQHMDGKLRQLGGSATAMEVYFLQCVLDYFIEKERINAEKIGVAGLSYGGMYAVHFTAAETRVKACYSCSWVNDCFVHSWADWSYFNAQKTFATAETVALIAPRPLVVAMGDKDNIFDYRLTVTECEKAKAYYKATGAEERLKYIVFDGVHETDKSDEELDFLFSALHNN